MTLCFGDKHASLLRYKINYGRKLFLVQLLVLQTRHEQDCHLRENEQDRMGWDGTRLNGNWYWV